MKNVLKFEVLLRNPQTSWKNVGIELLYREYVENLDYSAYDWEDSTKSVNEVTEKCKNFIEEISIRKLKLKKGKIFQQSN